MSQINSNNKDDFQVVFLLSCFVGHPVLHMTWKVSNSNIPRKTTISPISWHVSQDKNKKVWNQKKRKKMLERTLLSLLLIFFSEHIKLLALVRKEYSCTESVQILRYHLLYLIIYLKKDKICEECHF